MSILSKSKYNQSFASERWGVLNTPHFMCENFACLNKWNIYKIEWNKRIWYCVLCKDCLDHYNTMYSKAWPSSTYSKLLDHISDYIRSKYWDIKHRTIMDSLNALVWWGDTISQMPSRSRFESPSIGAIIDSQHESDIQVVWVLDDLSTLETSDSQLMTMTTDRQETLMNEMSYDWQNDLVGTWAMTGGWRSAWISRAREQFLTAIWIEEESYETATRG